MLLGLAVGCVTGGGMTDEEKIAKVLADWEQAVHAVDVDALMALYSDKFSHDGYDYEAEGKEGLQEFVDYAIDEGYFENVEMSCEGADTEIEGDTAVVYPVDFANDVGAVTIEFKLGKEKAGWLITDMIIEGL